MGRWVINYRFQLSIILHNKMNFGLNTQQFMARADCYANGLDMQQSIKFLLILLLIFT